MCEIHVPHEHEDLKDHSVGFCISTAYLKVLINGSTAADAFPRKVFIQMLHTTARSMRRVLAQGLSAVSTLRLVSLFLLWDSTENPMY